MYLDLYLDPSSLSKETSEYTNIPKKIDNVQNYKSSIHHEFIYG